MEYCRIVFVLGGINFFCRRMFLFFLSSFIWIIVVTNLFWSSELFYECQEIRKPKFLRIEVFWFMLHTMSMLGWCRVILQYQSDCDVSPVSRVVGLCSSGVYLYRIRGHRVTHQEFRIMVGHSKGDNSVLSWGVVPVYIQTFTIDGIVFCSLITGTQ